MPIRILIADDHGVVRAGLRALLDATPDIHVAGEAADGQETIRLTHELCPDIVLLDLSMPPGPSGIEILRQLCTLRPAPRVLILSAHEDEGLLRQAIKEGAAGYVIKRAVESELINAIQAAWRGDLYVHPAMTRALLQESAPARPIDNASATALTQREAEVLQLVAQGYTSRQVAERLSISARTVESHRANIMDKLELRGRVELVRYAREHGLIE
jgi:two-component system response regulator NreC